MCTISKTSLCLIDIHQTVFQRHASSTLDKNTGSTWSLTFLSVSSSVSLCSFWGSNSVFEARSQQKTWCLVFTFSCTSFFFSLMLMRCDSVFQRGPSLCRSVSRTVCCYNLHEAFVYIPNPKNRASLWQHCCRLTCDMPAHFLSGCLTPSLNLFPSISLWLPVALHLTSHSHLSASSWSDLSFLFL